MTSIGPLIARSHRVVSINVNIGGSIRMFTMFAKSPEVIREKMALAAAEIAALEADLPRLALECINADDDAPAKAAIDHLSELRRKQEVLTHGLIAAEQAQIAARDAQSARELLARRRASHQHIARLTKSAVAVSQAAKVLNESFAQFRKDAGSLVTSLPSAMQTEATGFLRLLSPGKLRDMALVEAERLDRENSQLEGERLFPRTPTTWAHEDNQGRLPALVDRVGEFTAAIRAAFDPATPAPATPMGRPEVSNDVPPLASPETSGMAPEPERPSYGIDLRGVDLGIPKVFTELESA
jgi:hypothetical protein